MIIPHIGRPERQALPPRGRQSFWKDATVRLGALQRGAVGNVRVLRRPPSWKWRAVVDEDGRYIYAIAL